jgi:hypothetical protein
MIVIYEGKVQAKAKVDIIGIGENGGKFTQVPLPRHSTKTFEA